MTAIAFPAPSAGVGQWTPCLDEDPDLFFAEAPEVLEDAKLVCARCPLRQECLQGAVERQEPHGVWGGQIFVDGVIVARKRPRGRPRKDATPLVPVILPLVDPRAA